MAKFDIAPFALPRCSPGEYWFEEARDIENMVLTFRGAVPAGLEVHYKHQRWP